MLNFPQTDGNSGSVSYTVVVTARWRHIVRHLICLFSRVYRNSDAVTASCLIFPGKKWPGLKADYSPLVLRPRLSGAKHPPTFLLYAFITWTGTTCVLFLPLTVKKISNNTKKYILFTDTFGLFEKTEGSIA